jgi:Cdc6-like AAA superfamily ATPase
MDSRKRRPEKPLTEREKSKRLKIENSYMNSNLFPKIKNSKTELNYDYECDEESESGSEYNIDNIFDKKLSIRSTNKQDTAGNFLNERITEAKFEEKKNKKNIYIPKLVSQGRRSIILDEDEKNEEEFKNENDELEVAIYFLPCREKEQEIIYSYIKKGLETKGSYTGLYISGMPGTGKTACVTTMINKLKNESNKALVSPFTVCEINGMKVTNPNNVFKNIYDHIFTDGRSTNLKKCTSILDNFFKNRKEFDNKPQLRVKSNPHIVLLIDEIDCLINKKQIVLYNMFNWTTYSQSKLIIISISNTLDLPEKLFPKISSRIGNNRLSFKPYQKDELVKILTVKVDNFELFSEDAIKLSSMKVAAVNGDLRRILQICRRAKEIFDSENHKDGEKIDKSHILRATEDLFDSKVQIVIQSLQLYEKITLAAILFQMKLQINNKVPVVQVYDRFKYFYVKTLGRNCYITFEDYMSMIYNLAKLQIITFCDGFSTNFINNTVSIKFYTDEFTVAMEKDDKFKVILQELSY